MHSKIHCLNWTYSALQYWERFFFRFVSALKLVYFSDLLGLSMHIFVCNIFVYIHLSKSYKYFVTGKLKCLRSLNTVKVNLSNFSSKCYCSTEFFVFHKFDTHKYSCKFNCLPLSNLRMLSSFEFQLPTEPLVW